MRLKTSMVLCILVVSCLSLGFIGKHDTLSGHIKTGTQKGTVFAIPIDDEGELEVPESMDEVTQHLKTQKPDVVFIFIHGWRNDSSSASLQNGDLHRFTTFIDETATLFGTHPTLKRWGQDTITGVYIGWHGHTWGALSTLSFWNRGKVATQIGNNTNLLVNIHTIIEQARKHRPHARVVLMAHSLGARIVNGLLEQIDNPMQSKSELPDLTIVMSPAAPQKELDRIIEHSGASKQDNRPKIVWITSTKDLTTRFVYPMGTFETAIAQDSGHLTHVVAKSEAPKNGTRLCNQEDPILVYNLACDQTLDDNTIRVSEDEYIKLTPQGKPHPYWVVRVPGEYLPNHMAFFNPKFQAILGGIFKYSKVGPQR